MYLFRNFKVTILLIFGPFFMMKGSTPIDRAKSRSQSYQALFWLIFFYSWCHAWELATTYEINCANYTIPKLNIKKDRYVKKVCRIGSKFKKVPKLKAWILSSRLFISVHKRTQMGVRLLFLLVYWQKYRWSILFHAF